MTMVRHIGDIIEWHKKAAEDARHFLTYAKKVQDILANPPPDAIEATTPEATAFVDQEAARLAAQAEFHERCAALLLGYTS